MKRSFIKPTLAIALSMVCLGGSIAYASIQSNSATTETTLEQERANTLQQLKESLTRATEKEELTMEDLELIQKDLSKAIESHHPGIGDGVEEVCNYIELQKANAEMEEFQKYLDTIDTTKYQPISQEELEQLLND